VTDPRVSRLADVVVNYSTGVKEGDVVLIQGPELAEPLIVEIVRATVAAGALPHVRASVQGVDEAYLAARMAQCFRDLGEAGHAARYARREPNTHRRPAGRCPGNPLSSRAAKQERTAPRRPATGTGQRVDQGRAMG